MFQDEKLVYTDLITKTKLFTFRYGNDYWKITSDGKMKFTRDNCGPDVKFIVDNEGSYKSYKVERGNNRGFQKVESDNCYKIDNFDAIKERAEYVFANYN